MGILPTDTYPALVCDISDKNAVEKLYAIKGLSPKKQLSILCRHLQDISTYTLGFPASNVPGQINLFRVARQVLPGPVMPTLACFICSQSYITGSFSVRWSNIRSAESIYHMRNAHRIAESTLVYALQYTFILTASKQLPKQCTDYQSGKSKQRKSVGVRIPDDDVLQVSILVIQ